MRDFLLSFSTSGDLALSSGDLATEDGLRTAVAISLFTDRRAGADELPEGESDSRGWWGDGLAGEGEGLTGSKLWLIAREKQTEAVRQRAEEYAREALAWLVEDGHAEAVSVSASWQDRGVLGLAIAIVVSDDSLTFDFEV